MSLNKELLDACNKLREAGAEIDKVLNVPRETSEEIKKLKDDNGWLLITAVAFGLFLGVSMLFHAKNALDNDQSYKALYEFERDHKAKSTINKMAIGYNEQLVKSLERDVKSLKEDLAFEEQASRNNKSLYRVCMSDK